MLLLIISFTLFAVKGKGYDTIMQSALQEQHPDIFGGRQHGRSYA